jgi:hypothetical protein
VLGLIFHYVFNIIISKKQLIESGDVFAWGNNGDLQLGFGSMGGFIATPGQVHFFGAHHATSVHPYYGTSVALLGLIVANTNLKHLKITTIFARKWRRIKVGNYRNR